MPEVFRRFWVAPALLCLLASGTAAAHKVVASAWMEGMDVVGEIGFSNGSMAPVDTPVVVFDRNMHRLGETRTGEDGLFRFAPADISTGSPDNIEGTPVSLILKADLGAGHVAEIRLGADEVSPESLTVRMPADMRSPDVEELRALIAEAVRQEVQPLRKQITLLQEKNGLQHILGGIGYIAGLFGLLFFIYGRRQTAGSARRQAGH